MKKFDLELAKAGHPICTRDGRNVRLICFDAINNHYPIIGLISYDGQEKPKSFTIDGKYIFGEDCFYNDLFMRD